MVEQLSQGDAGHFVSLVLKNAFFFSASLQEEFPWRPPIGSFMAKCRRFVECPSPGGGAALTLPIDLARSHQICNIKKYQYHIFNVDNDKKDGVSGVWFGARNF
jgi:hypothetical protein